MIVDCPKDTIIGEVIVSTSSNAQHMEWIIFHNKRWFWNL